MKYLRKPRRRKIGKHVCVPLYKGIPKEFQVGWSKTGDYGVVEWDNLTDLTPWLKLNPKLDQRLYCGTCGRIMVNGRRQDINLYPESRKIKLV